MGTDTRRDLESVTRTPLMRQPDYGTNGIALHFSKHEPVARKKAMPPEDFMNPDYPARLRELVKQARSAANAALELQSKASFRTIAEGLATIADEIERSGTLKG
jgi:hypothetical protein